ncbi:D-amino acid dehydrogenase [Algicella marina]|uniref:D-amino acid dehydrogenase n=2 Tax=Algicella marina TaxID=2683284 RepID=A0A6P1T7Y8_9RHOB|nr:D-amino acid dehydrogenase [Algicella marina]
MSKSIAVIGAGITGVTSAYQLVLQGFDVTVIDQNRYPAMETSYANGGQLSASNAEVWNSWRSVIKGIRWMLRPDAPLSISPRPSWHKYSWMAEFLSHIPNHDKNTIETARLAILSRDAMAEIAAVENIDYNRLDKGILHIYQSEEDLQAARHVNTLLEQAGLERSEVAPDEMRAIEPTLTGEYVGGFYTPSDSTGDIHRFCTGLAEVCKAKGVTFRMSTTIDSLAHQGDGIRVTSEDGEALHFDAVVICAGIKSREFAQQLGERINVYPVKGYSITVNLTDAQSRANAPNVSLLDDKAKIVSSRLGENRFRIAGTAELSGPNRDIRDYRIRPLIKWCEHHFPAISTEEVVPWAGLRPMVPSMMPRYGKGRTPAVYFNTGHGHLGWTLSAATSKLLAAEMAQDYRAVA